jgi:hypothetical protein
VSSAAGPINASNPYNVGALQDVAINNLRCSWVQPAGPPPQRPSPANASPANASLLRAQDVQVGRPPCLAPTDNRNPPHCRRVCMCAGVCGKMGSLERLLSTSCLGPRLQRTFCTAPSGGVHSHRVRGAGHCRHLHPVPGQVREAAGGKLGPSQATLAARREGGGCGGLATYMQNNTNLLQLCRGSGDCGPVNCSRLRLWPPTPPAAAGCATCATRAR